ncbi:MAG: hypothetical protein HRU19_27450 [Pseudobacteriovorax sp.]|nr:hypothetical protein [Pseudobacteriovorax sp.]
MNFNHLWIIIGLSQTLATSCFHSSQEYVDDRGNIQVCEAYYQPLRQDGIADSYIERRKYRDCKSRARRSGWLKESDYRQNNDDDGYLSDEDREALEKEAAEARENIRRIRQAREAQPSS